jgi:hypothetical protein
MAQIARRSHKNVASNVSNRIKFPARSRATGSVLYSGCYRPVPVELISIAILLER